MIEPGSKMNKIQYATLSKINSRIPVRRTMKNLLNIDSWMKTMLCLLAFVASIYIIVIIYECCIPKDQIIEITMPVRNDRMDCEIDPKNIADIEDSNFFEKDEKKYIYSTQKPTKTIKNAVAL